MEYLGETIKKLGFGLMRLPEKDGEDVYKRQVYKLTPLNDKMRKLGHVRKLWESILEITSVIDVFKNEPIKNESYDVDHFIPWSFVMNDELWNLMPMDSSLNSSKGNRLPQWDKFFIRSVSYTHLTRICMKPVIY